MGAIVQIIFIVIFTVELVMGSFGNGFIAFMNCLNWIKRRTISSADQILTALAVSRFSLLWVLLLDCWLTVVCPALLLHKNIVTLIYVFWTITNHFSIWLATCLSVFYFLKIARFSNSLFLYLKCRLKKVISGALLLSLLLLGINIIVVLKEMDVCIVGLERSMSYNSSSSNLAELLRLLSFQSFVFTLLPFAVSLTAFLLLIFSLWKHLKNVQQNLKGCRDSRTAAHIKALQAVVAFLLLYITFVSSLVIHVLAYENGDRTTILIDRATLTTFPSVHSFVLILGNSKLRQTLLSVLRWLRYRSTDPEHVGL